MQIQMFVVSSNFSDIGYFEKIQLIHEIMFRCIHTRIIDHLAQTQGYRNIRVGTQACSKTTECFVPWNLSNNIQIGKSNNWYPQVRLDSIHDVHSFLFLFLGVNVSFCPEIRIRSMQQPPSFVINLLAQRAASFRLREEINYFSDLHIFFYHYCSPHSRNTLNYRHFSCVHVCVVPLKMVWIYVFFLLL